VLWHTEPTASYRIKNYLADCMNARQLIFCYAILLTEFGRCNANYWMNPRSSFDCGDSRPAIHILLDSFIVSLLLTTTLK